MNPYSGLVDLAEKKGLLEKDGNKLKFTTPDGEEIKQFRKAWERNDDGCLDSLMQHFVKKEEVLSTDVIDENTEESDVD